MFNTSLLENIRLGDEHIGEEAIWLVLEQAQLANFVTALPEKLQTPLGEWGARLSGGQAQRVALARAFLKNAPLVLMDEPTAHLDADLEAALALTTQTLIRQRTVITIAHRFSTLQASDQIILLDHGRIAELGTHSSLLQVNGLYTALFRGEGGEA